jgi:selenocysteine lyase/cysteine desulfurase
VDRRAFLHRTGLTFAAAALAQGSASHAADADATPARSAGTAPAGDLQTWAAVRDLFPLAPEYLHFGGLYLASHPTPVREAIEAHRQGLDANPVIYLRQHGRTAEAAVLRAAGAYLGASPTDIALTDSTTMGLGLLYNGLDIRADQDVLTTAHDFSATHQSLQTATSRTGAGLRFARLYQQASAATADEIVQALLTEVRPNTRVVAITWVHSSTGVKLPVRQIADALAIRNRERAESEHALLCVDGVHALGVEDVSMPDLGADFLVAGCHKWLFGPRGTGIVWGHPRAWPAATPTIPSFSPSGGPAGAFTPGGFHSFEHRWALDRAFALHQEIGKARVAARVQEMATMLKDDLAAMPHVTLHTPRDPALSAGLVCFEVAGLAPDAVVARLLDRRIVATTTPYSPSYARLAPGLMNSPDEVETVLREVRALA